MAREQFDEKMHPRCPPLGGEVPFRHCRRLNGGLPCQRLLGCWQDQLDVLTFLREHYTLEELEPIFHPSKPRLDIMFETVSRVKGEGSDSR